MPDDAGGAGGEELGEQADQAPSQEDADHRQRPGLDAVVVDDGHDQPGDEPGLPDDEEAGDDTARDHPGQRAPRRGEAPHQPRVGRSHPTGASRRSWGMCCTVIRWRNTQ